mgnify:CR=1 FL=1
MALTDAPPPIRRIAVIGCGNVGASWAALFHAAGCDLTVADPAISGVAELEARLAPHLGALRELGLDGAGRLERADSPETACAQADLVQESAPESAAKADLVARLDAAAPAGAIIASSTSSLLLSDLTQGCTRPDRVILAHPFHPPHLIPLVELFGTTPDVIDRAAAFYRAIGKSPVVLRREMQGHIAGRLSAALFREAVHLVAEGVASVEDVDTALRDGPALRWSVTGAFLAYHLGGGPGGMEAYLAHLGPSQERRWKDLGDPQLTPEIRGAILSGVAAAYGDRSMAELEVARDGALMTALANR